MNRYGRMDQYIESVKIDSLSYDVRYGLQCFPVSIEDIPELLALFEGMRDKEFPISAPSDAQRLAELESSYAVLREQVRELRDDEQTIRRLREEITELSVVIGLRDAQVRELTGEVEKLGRVFYDPSGLVLQDNVTTSHV